MQEIAYAKVNLALHVRRRRPDGYHDIETVFAFAEEGDVLSVEEGEGLELAATGPFADDLEGGEDNLVLRAARALADAYEVRRGARLRLDKRLPVASGIGGGSADAAAALRLLSRWWGLAVPTENLMSIAGRLGADVPACLLSRTLRGDGKGDALAVLEEDLPGTPLLLVNPRQPLSTAAVFSAWDGIDRGPLVDWREGRNDLQSAACREAPVIGQVLECLSDADLSRMSGSGATCFGLYSSDDARDAAAARIRQAKPRWWLLPTRLR